MARSITFVIEDKVDTQITVTENDDGTLTFGILVLDTGKIGDLRALFFDLNGLTADGGLSVLSGEHVTESVFDEGNVDTVGGDGNINGSVTNEFGNFDVGIGFGTSGPGADDLQSTSFTLGHASLPLSLDMIDMSDFGIRTTSVGMKAGDQANGVAQNDVLTVDENQTGAVDLLVNDTNGAELQIDRVFDADGDFTVVPGGFERTVVIGGLTLGTLTVGSDGTASFMANGPDVDALAEGAMPSLSFSYQSVAADGSLATADVKLTISGLNDAPTMSDGALALDNDAPSAALDLSPLGADIDSDDDGTTLSYGLVGAPSEGSVILSGATLTFDPGSDFDDLGLGETRNVILTVSATDRHGASATGTVTVVVTGTNSAPVAQPDLTVTDEETVLTGNLFADNTAGMDLDPDGDTFTIHTVDGQPAVFGVPITLASGATLILQANGDFTFDPRGAFDFVPQNGQSADGIDYTVIDSNGAVSNEVRANFSVQGVNDAPVAENDALGTDEDTPLSFAAADLLANDSDADLGETPSLATINGVAASDGAVIATDHGSIAIGAGGALEYTPDANYSGPDSFIYTATDGMAQSSPATVTIDVTPVADAPTLSFESAGGGGGDLTPVPAGMDVQVNAVTNGLQHRPAITSLADGGYAITWTSTESGSNTVRAQFYDAAGNVRIPAVLVDSPASSFQQHSDIFQLAGGNLVVLSRGVVGAEIGNVFFQMLDTDGNRIGAQTPLSQLPFETGDGDSFRDRSMDQMQGSALEGGGFVTVWTERLDNAGQPVEYIARASIFDANGQVLQQDLLIGGPSTTEFTYSSVSGLPGGGFVAVWTDANAVFGQIYDASGATVGAEFQVSEHPLHTTGSPGTNSQLLVITLETGDFVVSWSGDEAGDFTNAANFRLYESDGTPVTGQVRANTWTGGEQEDQSVTALNDGGFIMTWSSDGQDGDSEGLFAQRFDATGAPVGQEYQVANTTVGHQGIVFGGQYTATLSDGRVVTVWDQDGASGEIFHNIATVPVEVDGQEDEPLAIPIAAGLVDIDGSETLEIRLSGFPAGTSFNLGAADGGDWVIQNAEGLDLASLVMTPATDWFGSFTLTVTATATETANGAAASTVASRDFTIAEVADPPLFTNGNDVVNFGGQAAANSIPVTAAGSYQDGTQYAGLDGDDEVWLADTAADAAAAGYDPSQIFDGGAGNDQIYGGELDDHIIGGAGNDRLEDRGGGNNTLIGGAGNDTVIIRSGNDVADGGDDQDTLRFDASGPAVTADIDAGTASGQGTDVFSGFETFGFTNSDDVITGSVNNVRVQLFDGNDQYTGGTGHEWLFLGRGDDTVDGGEGVDRVDYSLSATAVTVDLTAGTATGEGNDILIGVEQVFGSSHDDVLIGDSLNDDGLSAGFGIGYNVLYGGAGNDTVYGLGGDDDLTWQGAGDDLVYGGDGNDGLGGMEGNDLLDGGDGIDTAYYGQMTEAVNVNLATGVATQAGWTDTLISIENVTGSRGDDVIIGDDGANQLHGWFGSDALTGGLGADTFFFDLRQAFSGDNVITDFEIGTDVIDFLGGSFSTLADLNPLQVGADVHLELTNGTTLTLNNISLGNLSDSDFSF